jgi:transposase
MNDKQLYEQLLGLSDPWEVTAVDLDVENQTVQVHVAPTAGSKLSCPECGRGCAGYDLREPRQWRHLDSCGFVTYLVARIPRVQCPEHGVETVSVPWSEPHSRFTLAFSWFAIRVLQATKVQVQAANLMRLNPGQVHDLMQQAVRRGLERREDVPLKHLSVDEKSYGHGHRFLSALGDSQGGRVLEVVEGRTREAANELLGSLSPTQREAVDSVSMDMWHAFMAAREELLPQADTVHDRFHIAAYLNRAVDLTRRSEIRDLRRQGDDAILAHSKYIWLKNPENLTVKQQKQFELLMQADLKTAQAWALKENFRHFFTCGSVEAGREFFSNWHEQVVAVGNRHMIKVAAMLQRHLSGLLAYFHHHTTNAGAEGLNGQIQLIKANARGYRRFENFRVAILFFLGKLNMNPQKSS